MNTASTDVERSGGKAADWKTLKDSERLATEAATRLVAEPRHCTPLVINSLPRTCNCRRLASVPDNTSFRQLSACQEALVHPCRIDSLISRGATLTSRRNNANTDSVLASPVRPQSRRNEGKAGTWGS